MIRAKPNFLLCRVAAALTLSWPVSEASAQALPQCAATGTNQTCMNSMAITGGAVGISDTATLTITNTSAGTVSGTSQGINAANVNVVGNDGTIEGTDGNRVGIFANSDGGTVTVTSNNGTIRETGANGIAIQGDNINITSNNGTIETTAAGSIAIVVTNATVASNNGKISGGKGGISAVNATITANAGTIEATGGGGNASAISALQTATVNNSGTISAVVAGGIAIQANNTATVSNIGDGISTGIITAERFAIVAETVNVTANTGLIEVIGASRQAISATTATVNNSGTIRAGGQNGIAITGQTVNVTGNTGTIEAGIGPGITGGIAIFGGTADVTTSGAIQASSMAIVTDGLLTLNNTGSITSGGQFAVVSNNGDVNVNQNVTGSTGRISAIAAGGIAIEAAGTVTVGNNGDGVHGHYHGGKARDLLRMQSTSPIPARSRRWPRSAPPSLVGEHSDGDNRLAAESRPAYGIFARTVDITANAGIIEATGGVGGEQSPPQTPSP